MKTKSLFFILIISLPIGLMAQSDLTIDANYLPYESAILIQLVNNTDKQMRIYNSYDNTGSLIQFHLKDKTGKEFSLHNAAYCEGIDYKPIVRISPHSAKTIKYSLESLCPSKSTLAEIYSVDASCFIKYSIPPKNIYDFLHKVLTIKTKQDLMIYGGYDSHAQKIMITLSNMSDYEIAIHNSSRSIQFSFLNQQGTRLAKRGFPFILRDSKTAPNLIKIAPRSEVILAYPLSCFSSDLQFGQSGITIVEADCSASYDISAQNVTNKLSQRTLTIKIK